MRMTLLGIFLVVFSILSLPLYLIAWILGKKNPKLQVAFSQKIVRGAFRVMYMIAGVRVHSKGMEKVPKDEAVMFIGNHRSYCDILTSYLTTPKLTFFISKEDLKYAPCVGTWMRFLKCLFLNRENPKEGLKTILQGIEQIKQGYSAFIMPEGTRNDKKELLPFHEGSFKLATKTGCPIVPVTMKNNEKVVGHHFAWFSPTNVYIEYGDPVYLDDLTAEERKHVGAYMREKMKVMLDKME